MMRYIFDGFLTEGDINFIERQTYNHPILLKGPVPLAWQQEHLITFSVNTVYFDDYACIKASPCYESFLWQGGSSAHDPDNQKYFYFFRSIEDKQKVIDLLPNLVDRHDPFKTWVEWSSDLMTLLKRPFLSWRNLFRSSKS